MKKRFELKTNMLVAYGFAFTVLVVLMITGLIWKVVREADDAALSVLHTHEVLDNLAEAKAYTSMIEAYTLRYLIYGDAAQLAERDLAISARETSLSRIKQLTADNTR